MAESRTKKSGKRTARACDECRMRKAKCDGLQPCQACQSTDRYCTYNLSAGRSNGSGTRIRILEERLRRARAYLNEAQRRTPSLAHVNFDALLEPSDEYGRRESKAAAGSEEDDKDQEKLDSMMDSYGRMTMNANGCMGRDFYGAASGLAWIQKAGHYFEDSEGSPSTEIDNDQSNDSAAVQLFDAPLPPTHALQVDFPVPQLLPPRETATKLLHVVFTQVYPMFHFLCEEDFQDATDRIYGLDPNQFQERDQEFLPLFNFVIALGYLFSREEHDKRGCRTSLAQGMRHFVAARSMLDIAQLRTIVSLQSIICVVLFLISTARMASAHAFFGAACASAMRQGLHFRSTHESNFPDKEKKVRRRVFWAVVNLDMYVSSILGLPPFMDITAVDPAIDLTIENALREVTTDAGISSGDGLSLAASAKHIELMRIVFKAQRTLFPKPTDPPDAKQRNGRISVSVPKLQKVEAQFREWEQTLTQILSHSDDSIETQSIKYEMHLCYYFAQIVLYRAFLHYLAKQHEDGSAGSRQVSYAQKCVRIAKKVVEISIEHQRIGLLCPASWPSVYTTFLSIVCLIFAYATRKNGAETPQVKQDIENGIRLLACTACTTDTGSVRCLEILRRLIKRVSYAVDVDLDKICADTKPCCTTEFKAAERQGESTKVDDLHIPAIGLGRLGNEAVTSISQASSNTVLGGDGHQWSLSPEVTMTQPSFADLGYSSAEPITASEMQAPEELMEIPYGGTFSWPEHEFHAAALRLGQLRSSNARLGQDNDGSNTSSTDIPPSLSAEDIAAFMHVNVVDEPFRRPNGKERTIDEFQS